MRFAEASPGRRRWLRGVGVAVSIATVVLLVSSLRRVDWSAFRQALPTGPGFYLLFLVWYLWLPASDAAAYRLVWPLPLIRSLRAFVVKRIYNRELLQYSGEVYFYHWARKRLPAMEPAALLRMVRDQNIIQSVASTAVAVVLGGGFAVLALPDVVRAATSGRGPWFVAGVAGGAVLVGGLLFVARGWSSLPAALARRLLGWHAVRFAADQGLQIVLWHLAAPAVAWSAWFAFGAVSLVIARVPLITNRELVFASVGIGLASRFSLPVESVAATMLVVAGLSKLLTFVFFVADRFSRRGRDGSAPAPSPPAWVETRNPPRPSPAPPRALRTARR